jgi:type III restriction enzyme
MSLSEENIDQLFDAAGRMLAAGEGLHRTYWKRYHNHAKPNEAKLEIFALMRKPDTTGKMEQLAREQFTAFWRKHESDIKKLPAADKARFYALIQASGKPSAHELDLPERIVEKKDGAPRKKHLYCDAQGDFYADLNSWEEALLDEAMNAKGFVGWLRNLPRRDWALCIPYELAGVKPFYPDFIIVRKKGQEFQVDILEPHDDSRADTWAKAKGLATFADSHGMNFGRLIIARKRGEHFQLADMNDPLTRKKASKMQSQNDLEGLFG